MESLLIFVNIVLAVILVIIILLQRSEGGGLVGGTGDFRDVGARIDGMDNLLFGIRDVDFPNFIHGEIKVPKADSADENGICQINLKKCVTIET